MLENNRFVNKEVSIDDKWNTDESFLYQRKAVDVLKRENQMCRTEARSCL